MEQDYHRGSADLSIFGVELRCGLHAVFKSSATTTAMQALAAAFASPLQE